MSINRVLEIFEELCRIPHGSGNCHQIAQYCVQFAQKNGLRYHHDNADNVVIYKEGSQDCQTAQPVILQGHLDMVCQKNAEKKIDFLKEGITVRRDGDFLHADGTTLGADNGIAVAMVLSVLERNDLSHPPIEAVFTTDEEVGMIGAFALDTSLLSAKRLINLDSEQDDTVTVSCAGGSDVAAILPLTRTKKQGECITLTIGGLKGGHSGVEIDKHRVNAAKLLGRLLNDVTEKATFDMLSIDSGDKANAIPCTATARLVTQNAAELQAVLEQSLSEVKDEIICREPDFYYAVSSLGKGEYAVFSEEEKADAVYILMCVPNGIMEMSAEIEGLVQTSLNLGVLQTKEDAVRFQFALRSNKTSALRALEKTMLCFFSKTKAAADVGGQYPPWEYRQNSELQKLYVESYKSLFDTSPKVEAIHAGLECAVFSSSIKGADCIAVGPTIYDAHTTAERLSVSSTEKVYTVVLRLLEQLAKE